MSIRNKLLVLTAVLASLLEIIDTSIVNVAIPSMMGNLGATIDEISWVITGYIIANAIVLPISGWMSEQFGRKLYYTSCIVAFTLLSVACGFAPNLELLILFRILQGLAGGALLPTSQALIYEAFPREQAGMASAIYGMSVLIGPTIAPTLGGYLTDTFGWRSIFNINLPVGIIVCVLSYLLVEDLPVQGETLEHVKSKKLFARRSRKPIDTWGLVFLVVGIGSLQFFLERGHAEDWFDSKLIILTGILAVAGIVALIWWELRTKHPILELKHFKNPIFANGVLLMSALGAGLYALLFLIPIFVSSVTGLTAEQTGLLFMPGALCAALTMPFIGKYLKKGEPTSPIFIGFILLGAAFVMMSYFDSQTSAAGMFWPLLVRGIAMGFLFVPINSFVLTQFQGHAVGQAAGMLNLCRQIGGSLAIALCSTVFQQSEVRNYTYLSYHVSPLHPATFMAENAIHQALHSKMPKLVGLLNDSQDVIKILYFKVKTQAFVLSFQQVMFSVTFLFAIALIPLYLMRRERQRRLKNGTLAQPQPTEMIDAHAH